MLAAAITVTFPASATPVRVEGFGTFSPLAVFDTVPASEGHGPSSKAIVEGGAGADAFFRLGPPAEVGVGPRYDIGGTRTVAHLVTVPATFRYLVPFGAGWHEIRVALGFGPAFGYYAGGTDLRGFGFGTEALVGYRARIAREVGLFAHLGARFAWTDLTNAADGDLAHAGVLNLQLGFIRLGVSWEPAVSDAP